LRSIVLINKGGGSFEKQALPTSAQLSTAMSIIVKDINNDKRKDLLIFGNNYAYRVNQGKSDAKAITFLLGDQNGSFSISTDQYLNTSKTWGEYRNAAFVNETAIIAVRNNEKPILLQLTTRD
jgi:hypothetical protein